MTGAERYPNAPIADPDCPRCREGSLQPMTGFPDRYARCAVYLVCEAGCGYEQKEDAIDYV